MDLTKTPTRMVGEVVRFRGHKSMCAMADVSFGGGRGNVWVTENTIYDFATKTGRMFLRGICRELYPAEKVVRFEIVDGLTWGRYRQGSCWNIHADDLTHIRVASVHGSKMIFDSQCAINKARADVAFADTSISELVDAYRHEHEQDIAALLGEREFMYTKELLQNFLRLCQSYRPAGVNGHRMPSPTENEAKQKIWSLLKRGPRNGGENN